MKTARLLYSDLADWIYATDLIVSDPHLLYIDTQGRRHGLISPLEFDKARNHSRLDFVHAYETLHEKVKARGATPSLPEYIRQFVLDDDQPEVLEVPAEFPAGLFQKLTEAGLPLHPVEGPFFPSRITKTVHEIEALRQAQAANQQGFIHARHILAEADIGPDNLLLWQGTPLTSERLRQEINQHLVGHGVTGFGQGQNVGPIVAGGAQAALPHEEGYGALYAHQFIIIDSFPRHANHYYGDLTRTYVKGTPTPWHHDVYMAVLEAQEAGLAALRAGTTGDAVHHAVQEVLDQHDFATGQTEDGTYYGFFHSTGHHVGLEVHDVGGRLLSPKGPELTAGIVCSVEPGLYYPPGTHTGGIGGCRIEDVVAVTETGHDNLTTLPKNDWIVD